MSTFIGLKINKQNQKADAKKGESRPRAKEPTVAEIKAKLDELSIEYSANATKAELLDLLPQE